jgi:hypothetical protein
MGREGFVDYRHPVQGWSMPLPVEDVENAPEVFYVRNARLERVDIPALDPLEALSLVVARALCKPALWDGLRSDERETWMARGRIAVDALAEAGAFK